MPSGVQHSQDMAGYQSLVCDADSVLSGGLSGGHIANRYLFLCCYVDAAANAAQRGIQ